MGEATQLFRAICERYYEIHSNNPNLSGDNQRQIDINIHRRMQGVMETQDLSELAALEVIAYHDPNLDGNDL